MIDFDRIPLDLRTPGQYVEFNATRAVSGLPLKPMRILLIGQRTAAGAVAALAPVRIVSADEAAQAFGRGSMLHAMAVALKRNDDTTECWAMALDDLQAGVAATGTVTVAGPATGSGTVELYVAGRRISAGAAAGDTAAQIAARLKAALDLQPDLPCTAAVNGAVITLTARHKGLSGNGIDVRTGYHGEVLPAGVGVAVAAFAGGAGEPDAGAATAAIGEQPFDVVIHPYADAANLTAIEQALEARWGPMAPAEGYGFTAARGTYGQLAALGASRNSAFNATIGAKGSPTPTWEWAAAMGGACALALGIDPARPVQTLPLRGVLPPAPADRFTRAERDLLLRDGISTFTVDSGGTVLLERVISSYQQNAFGFEDPTWLDVNTPFTLSYLRFSLRFRIAAKFPRHKLAGDGAVYGADQAIVTPSVIRAEIVALAGEWVEAGLVEDLEAFKRLLRVERSGTDPNRVDALVPPDLVNQFRVFAAQVQFRV